MVLSYFTKLAAKKKSLRQAPRRRFRLAPLGPETLEERVVPSVTTDLTQGILSIHADSNPNQVQVLPANQNVQVLDSGQVVGTFAADQVQLVAFQYGAGPSTYDNETGIPDTQLRLYDSGPLTPAQLRQTGHMSALLDGGTLTLIGPSGAGFQIAGNWAATAQTDDAGTTHTFTASGPMVLLSALGPLPFVAPDTDPVTVTTAPDTQQANFGAVASVHWSSGNPLDPNDPHSLMSTFANLFHLQVAANMPQFGVALGGDLGGLGAPLNNALPYIYFTTPIAQGPTGVTNLRTVAFDPEDPFLYARTDQFTAGVSLKGYIPYTPTVALPGLDANPLYGHLYIEGPVALGGVPATITGSAVINLDAQHDGVLLSAVVQDLGGYLSTGQIDLSSLLAVAPNDIRAGLNGHAVINYSQGGFALNLPADASALYVPGDLTVHGTAAGNLFGGTPLSFLGTNGTLDLTADVNTQGLDVVTTSGTSTVGGFTTPGFTVELNNQGVSGTGTLHLQYPTWSADVNVNGSVLPSGQYSFDGHASAQFAGFGSGNAHFVLTNNGLSVDGDVSVPVGAQTATVHFVSNGYIHSDGQFDLAGTAQGSLTGFSLSNATFDLNNSGLTVGGTLIAQLGTGSATIPFTGYIHTDGQYSVSGDASASFAGFTMPDAHFVLNNSGLTVNGDINVPIGSATVPVHFSATGPVSLGGQFNLDGHASATYAGFAMPNAHFVLSNSGLTADGTVTGPASFGAPVISFTGYVHPDGQFSLDGHASANFAGFASANAHFVLNNNGLGVDGDVGVPVGTQTVTVHFAGAGYVHTDGQYNLTGTATAAFAGFNLPNGTFTLANSGLAVGGTVTAQLGTGSATIPFTGYIHTDGQYSLSGTAQANFAGFSMPAAHFVLNNSGLSVDGDINVTLGSATVPVHFTSSGTIQLNGQFNLDGHANATLAGFGSANAHFVLTNNGLSLDGDVNVPEGTQTVTVHFVSSGYVHTDGQFNLTGTAQGTFDGFVMPGAHFVLNNSGLTVSGTVTSPASMGSANIPFAGYVRTNGQYNLTGTAGGTFSGFTLTNVHYVLSNSGLTLDGDGSLRIGPVSLPVHFTATGYIQLNGQYNLDGHANATFAGFAAANADFTLNNSGLTAHGNVDFHLLSLDYVVPFTGYLHTDGQYSLTATVASLTFGGFGGTGVSLTLNNSGLTAAAHFQLGSVVNESLTGTIYTNGQFSLVGGSHVSFVGFGADSTFTLTTGGVAISAGVTVPAVGGVHMGGSIATNGTFQLTYSGSYGVNGYGGSGWLRLDNSGVSAHLDVGLSVLGLQGHLDGSIHSNGQFQLTASASLHLGPINGSLGFTLNNSGFSAHAAGSFDLTATVHGPFGASLTVGFRVAVDVSFAVATNGTFGAGGNFTATAYLGLSLSVGIGFSLDNHTFTIHTHDIGFSVWFISFHPFGDTVIHY